MRLCPIGIDDGGTDAYFFIFVQRSSSVVVKRQRKLPIKCEHGTKGKTRVSKSITLMHTEAEATFSIITTRGLR